MYFCIYSRRRRADWLCIYARNRAQWELIKHLVLFAVVGWFGCYWRCKQAQHCVELEGIVGSDVLVNVMLQLSSYSDNTLWGQKPWNSFATTRIWIYSNGKANGTKLFNLRHFRHAWQTRGHCGLLRMYIKSCVRAVGRVTWVTTTWDQTSHQTERQNRDGAVG